MRTLSFDTSNPVLTVALMEDGKIVATKRVVPPDSSRQEAVSQLMPTIDSIIAENNWSRPSIDLIIVGVGPGSFTGMRTSVVTARTLAQTLNVPLIGVDSLRCLAATLPLPSTIVLSGGRGHYFIASYSAAETGKARWQSGDASMKCDLEPCCLLKEEFIAALKQAQSCFSEDKILDEVRSYFPSAEAVPEDVNLAVVQAELVHSDLDLNNKDRDKLRTIYAFDKVNPLYLRGASITLKPTQVGDQAGNRN
jgi:tRNA threonylcarbamoyl adenosine modification protein YeaZ